jgi:hypothetical protein
MFFLKNQENYKCSPYHPYTEGVLYVEFVKEIEHLLAVDLSLNE